MLFGRSGGISWLVVGLGNRRVTPDSLGPKTVDGTLVTRHLLRELPDKVDERLNPVCAIAPWARPDWRRWRRSARW